MKKLILFGAGAAAIAGVVYLVRKYSEDFIDHYIGLNDDDIDDCEDKECENKGDTSDTEYDDVCGMIKPKYHSVNDETVAYVERMKNRRTLKNIHFSEEERKKMMEIAKTVDDPEVQEMLREDDEDYADNLEEENIEENSSETESES